MRELGKLLANLAALERFTKCCASIERAGATNVQVVVEQHGFGHRDSVPACFS